MYVQGALENTISIKFRLHLEGDEISFKDNSSDTSERNVKTREFNNDIQEVS